MNHLDINHTLAETALNRYAIQSESPDTLADIYQDDINIAIWQRDLSLELLDAVDQILSAKHAFRFAASVEATEAYESIYKALGANEHAKLISTDVAETIDMFCLLFDLKQVGLRLTALDKAMCPKFHVDRVPCRLVSTYSGIATEWLPHKDVNRDKLGMGSEGKPDSESDLYKNETDIQQLNHGDIALLKGESWLGNEGGGLVHRSPSLNDENKRLLLTLDFN